MAHNLSLQRELTQWLLRKPLCFKVYKTLKSQKPGFISLAMLDRMSFVIQSRSVIDTKHGADNRRLVASWLTLCTSTEGSPSKPNKLKKLPLAINKKPTLVISYYREDLSWIDEYKLDGFM